MQAHSARIAWREREIPAAAADAVAADVFFISLLLTQDLVLATSYLSLSHVSSPDELLLC